MKLKELQITEIDYFTLEGGLNDIEISLYLSEKIPPEDRVLNAIFDVEKHLLNLLGECEVVSVDLRAGAVVLKRNVYNEQMLFEAAKIFAKKGYYFIVSK